MVTNIRRNDALREMDIKEDPRGKQVLFSIKFVKDNGEIVFFPRAVASGLRCNMSKNRVRAVVPVDQNGDKIGHVYPVSIDLIIEWNGKTVVL